MSAGRAEAAPHDFIEGVWRERWGLPIVSVGRVYLPADVEGLVWRDAGGSARGLVTWCAAGEEAEIVTLDSFEPGGGVGGRLLAAAEAELGRRGVRKVTIVTTNDNLRAFAFYVRRGYRLFRLDLDGMERVRRLKPGVPETGDGGIPLRDMLELGKELR